MCCLEEDTGASGGAHQDCGPAFAHLHMLCILLGDACVALQATGSCLRAQPGSGDALRKASSLYITEQDTSKIQPAYHAAFRCALSTAGNDSENTPVSHRPPHVLHCHVAAADVMALGLWGLLTSASQACSQTSSRVTRWIGLCVSIFCSSSLSLGDTPNLRMSITSAICSIISGKLQSSLWR